MQGAALPPVRFGKVPIMPVPNSLPFLEFPPLRPPLRRRLRPISRWNWWAGAGWQRRASARVIYVAQWRPPFAHIQFAEIKTDRHRVLLLPRVGTATCGFSFPHSVVRLPAAPPPPPPVVAPVYPLPPLIRWRWWALPQWQQRQIRGVFLLIQWHSAALHSVRALRPFLGPVKS
jgi:hypothetical protein